MVVMLIQTTTHAILYVGFFSPEFYIHEIIAYCLNSFKSTFFPHLVFVYYLKIHLEIHLYILPRCCVTFMCT